MSGIILLLKHSVSHNPEYKQFSQTVLRILCIFPACQRLNAAQGLMPSLINSKQLRSKVGPVWFLSHPWDFEVVAPKASRLKALSYSYSILSPFCQSYDIFHPLHHFQSIFQSAYLITDCIAVWLSLALLCKSASRAKSGLDTFMDEIESKEKKASFRRDKRYTCYSSELQQSEAWSATEVSQYFRMPINKYIFPVWQSQRGSK